MTTAEAQQILQRAFDRLDAAARKLEERTGGGEALRAERDRLSANLAKLRSDHAELEQIAESASTRLDTAIGRLAGALEG